FLNDGGPIGERRAQQSLVEHAVAEAKRSGAGLLELRSREEVPGPVTPSNRRISVHLSLPSSVEELWKTTFRAKVRSQIRRPGKEGMVFRSSSAELSAFYEVFTHNMRDLGTPVLPRAFFERIESAFGDRVIFSSVYTSAGVPAAVACCFLWRDELEVMWASSIRELNQLSPNMLLYGSLMEEAIRRGVHVFNFGRCSPGGATHRFKQQWGGNDVRLPWPSWSRDAAIGVPSTDRVVYRLATSAWKRLPLALANRLGPPLARLLP
ncbi:MAG: GNAT family N-acetyltransferase, partial [Gemmatimonadota bacterium]|nr:GNAT family N-acetyltransferase [Gemmatimonadota bacterium]